MVAPEVLLVMLLKELATPPMTTTLRVDRLKIDRDNKMKKIKALINEVGNDCLICKCEHLVNFNLAVHVLKCVLVIPHLRVAYVRIC